MEKTNKKDKIQTIYLKYIFNENSNIEDISKDMAIKYYSKPTNLIIERGENGKPYFSGGTKIFFNGSHSKDLLSVAMSDKSVGIDVEYVRNISDTGYKIMKKCFHPEEIKYIHKKENKSFDEAFFTIWTRKEAILKRNGTGMICDMKAINTVSEENRMAIHNIFYGKYIIALCE